MTSRQPLVSVIIAYYNHRDYIKETIDSVLAQTWPNLELIVVDDGSTDGGAEFLAPMAREKGFQFHRQENIGYAPTLNRMLAMAKGDYIAPLGSDDIILPEKTARQVAFLEAHPDVVVCASNVELIDGEGRPCQKQKITPARELTFHNVFANNVEGFYTPSVMIRREDLVRIGGWNPEIRLEDLYLWLALTEQGKKIAVLDDVLAKYRLHDSNTFRKRRFMYDEIMKTYQCFSQYPEYPGAVDKIQRTYFNKAMKENNLALADYVLGQSSQSSWFWQKARLRYWFRQRLAALAK